MDLLKEESLTYWENGWNILYKLYMRGCQAMKLKEEPKDPTSEKTDDQNTRFLKIGNTTFEISRHYSGTNTYEDIVKNAIKREAESG